MSTKDMVKREQALQSAKHALALLNEISDSGYDALDCFAILDLETVIRDLTNAARNAEIAADWAVTDGDYNLRGF